MKKEIKNVDIKEIVIELKAFDHTYTSESDDETTKIVELTAEKKVRKKASYTVKFSSGCDFAINRKTDRTDKTLVVIYSKRIFYIYDELKNTKKAIVDVTQVKRFFADKNADDLILEPDIVPYLKSGVKKNYLDMLFDLLVRKEPGIEYVIKRGLFDFSSNGVGGYNDYARNSFCQKINAAYLESPSILNIVLPNLKPSDNLWNHASSIEFATIMYKIGGIDIARYAYEKREASSVRLDRQEVLEDIIPKYGLDERRVIDYLFFDLYKQGKTSIPIGTYQDYLRMSVNYYGKVKDKYPKHLFTDHRILALKCAEKEKIKGFNSQFYEIMSECEDFSYRNPIDKYKIVMPKEAEELIEEGNVLGHCVASYIEKVVAGDCIVVFMREDVETPYLTVEILPDKSVPQVEGLNKRSELTEEEILFLNRWAKKKGLKITAENAMMSKEELKKIS